MSDHDFNAGMSGKAYQPGMDLAEYERGVRFRLGPKVEVPGVAYTLIIASPLLPFVYPVLGLVVNGTFAGVALLASRVPGVGPWALLIGFVVGIVAFFPGLWFEARASQVTLYRIGRTCWRLLAPLGVTLLASFDESGRFRPAGLNTASGEVLGAGILIGLVIHFVCSLLDQLYFPVKAHVLKQREQLAKGTHSTRPLIKRLVYGALWMIPIYILCKVAIMIGVRQFAEDVRSVEAFEASYSTIVNVASGVIWYLLCLFGVLPGTSKRAKMLVDPNLVNVG